MVPSQPLYNHNACPAIARQLGMLTTPAGHTTLSYVASNVFVNPPPQIGHKHAYYAMDFDDAPASDNITLDDLLEEEELGESTIIAGTNIYLVSLAKRYHNSVHVTLTYHLTMI
jgi:hypothetical protein